VIAPWVIAWLVCPNLLSVLHNAPVSSILWSYFFGLLWGIGGLTFGLSMRYLGMSLGYALALGFCAAFGTIIPPIFKGEFVGLISKLPGQVVLSGVLVCLAGIAVSGRAGVRKERELSDAEKTASISEFNFAKGVWIAVFAGIMSACMAFAIAFGAPIAKLAVANGTPTIWQNSPVYIFIFAGGFTTNFIWCLFLNLRNGTGRDYVSSYGGSLSLNYIFSALAGITWYMQFMFYGMGQSRMGRYDFSSWTIHMAFIIIFSTIWGLLFHEWKGSSRGTHRLVFAGITVLILSTIVVGLGNYLNAAPK
jgi:L-rhamnose-H+ transport protein